MCLQSDNIIVIAQEDIICYKLYVKSSTMNGGKWFSPFRQCFMPEFGETIKAQEVVIHTFSTIEGAIRLTTMFSAWILDMIRHSKPIDVQIVKCIIPKNSEYIQGIDKGTNSPAYCSKELKFIESVAILNKENYWQEIEKLYDRRYNF